MLAQAREKAADLCAVIPVARLNQLLGSDFGASSGGTNGVPCSYTAKRGSEVGKDVGAITGISARTTTSLQEEAEAVGAQYGITQVKPIDVPGAGAAYQVTGTSKGVNTAIVVAEKDGVSYDALCGGSRSSATYATGLVKVVNALIVA